MTITTYKRRYTSTSGKRFSGAITIDGYSGIVQAAIYDHNGATVYGGYLFADEQKAIAALNRAAKRLDLREV